MKSRDRLIFFCVIIILGSVIASFNQEESYVTIDDVDSVARVRPLENRLIFRLDTSSKCNYLFVICFKHNGGKLEGVCPPGFCEIAVHAKNKRITTKKLSRIFGSPYIEIEVTPTGFEFYRGDLTTFENSITVDSCVPVYDKHGYIELTVPIFEGNCPIFLPRTDLGTKRLSLPHVEYIFAEIVLIAAVALAIVTVICIIHFRKHKVYPQPSTTPNISELVSNVPTESPSRLRAKNLESKKNQDNIESIVIQSLKTKKTQKASKESVRSVHEIKTSVTTSGKAKQTRVTLSKLSGKMPRKAESPFKKEFY